MYSDADILQAIENGDISITIFNKENLNSNSYNITLGNTFYEVFWDNEGPFYVGPYIFEQSEKIIIPVGGTLLGMTAEKIGAKGKVVASMQARSSSGRMGITVCRDAGLGDVGYNDHWTLELTSYTTSGQPFLCPGDVIGQVVFHECKSEPSKMYDGQYQIDWPLNMIPKQWRHRVVAPNQK